MSLIGPVLPLKMEGFAMQKRRLAIFDSICVIIAAFGITAVSWSQSSTTYPDIPWLTDDPIPDLSGTWLPVASRMDEGWRPIESGAPLEISQTQDRFIVTEQGPNGRHTLTYQLDSSQSRNETTTAAGNTWERVARARWMEGAIVIETTINDSFEELTMYFRSLDGRLHVVDLGPDIRSPQIMGLRTVVYEMQS